jgi:hypothetical protein
MSETYTPIDLADVTRRLAEPMNGSPAEPQFRLSTHDGHPRLALVRFHTEGAIEFVMASQYPSWTSPGALAHRLSGARILFTKLRALCPDLTGECRLWLGDIPAEPALAFCSNTSSSLLIPDADFLRSNGYSDLRRELATSWIPWPKRDTRVFWRGTLSGDPDRVLADWRLFPRVQLCLRAQQPGSAEFFDIQLTGRPIQLKSEADFAEMTALGLFGESVPMARSAGYRAVVDIDGNSSAWSGLFTKLLMGCTVLKIDTRHGWRQWYYDQLVPWVNFIPVLSDLRDIEQAAAWIGAHPREAEAIAERGRSLASSITVDQAVLEIAPRLIAYIRATKNPV